MNKSANANPYRSQSILRGIVNWGIPLIVGCLASLPTYAINQKKAPRIAPIAKPVVIPVEPSRSSLPVLTTTSAGADQAGYVHYFLITHPDGTLEYQLGIEMEDKRVAWSFPGVGVSVAPFIESGSLDVNGKAYGIKHLFGIRPFPDMAKMRTLQKELLARVALFVDYETPYCFFRTSAEAFCLSCGDFVLRILFPGRTVMTPALPRDFGHSISGDGLTTDDLLLYLLGLHDLSSKDARLKRIGELGLPGILREEAIQLVETMGTTEEVVTKSLQAKPAATPPTAVRATKPVGKVVQDKQLRKRI
jgi:hypothetical protein